MIHAPWVHPTRSWRPRAVTGRPIPVPCRRGLTPEDTKKLAAFTQGALHKTIVIRLGETILMAPKVNEALTRPDLGIALREGPNTPTIEAGLKKLAE